MVNLRMSKKITTACLVVVCLGLMSGCATPVTAPPLGTSDEFQQERQLQTDAVYQRIIEDEDRLYDIAFPMMAANTSFCGAMTAPALGMTYWNLPILRKKYRAAAFSLYNLQDDLAVQHIAHDSPAYRAGIRSGDVVIAVNGQNIPKSAQARQAVRDILKRASFDRIEFSLGRAGKPRQVSVTPVAVCSYGLAYNPNDSAVNAMSDGKNVIIPRGMMRFAENDNELALVIGHEMAHNAMGHVDKQSQNALMGGLGGLLVDSLLSSAGVSSGGEFTRMGQAAGVGRYSVAFEQEADYVGMYFMERAGYSASGAGNFWRRWAAEDSGMINNRSSHPTSPERFIAITHTYDKIRQKKSSSQQLVPSFREDQR